MKFLSLILATLITTPAFAGFQGVNGSTNLGIFNKLTCSTGLSCSKVGSAFSIVSSPTVTAGTFTIQGAALTSGDLLLNTNAAAIDADKWKLSADSSTDSLIMYNKTSGSYVAKLTLTSGGNMTVAGTSTLTGAATLTGGIATSAATKTIFSTWNPGAVANATSATPSATVVYMSEIFVPHNETITGIAVLNAATVGTNKWIFALFDSTGAVVANTALAGVTTSGASVFQKIAFTGTYAAKGPKTYWIGAYMNGTTDRYYAIPTLGQMDGLAGSVSAQTFGTVASVTLPTSFTADVAPVAYVY